MNHTESHIRKCTDGYKLTKSKEKASRLKYMDDIKLLAEDDKKLETLKQAVRIYSNDIGMEFNIQKCSILIMKSRKRQMKEGKELPNQDKIRTLGEKETYKYLGILEADTLKQAEMKEKILKEYLGRKRKLLVARL